MPLRFHLELSTLAPTTRFTNPFMQTPIDLMRIPTAIETGLVGLLLKEEFEGAEAVRAQASKSRVLVDDLGGVLVLRFQDAGLSPRADVRVRIPVEGVAQDADGVMIHALLHVVHGFLSEVEIFREDSAPILRMPPVAEFQLIVLGN